MFPTRIAISVFVSFDFEPYFETIEAIRGRIQGWEKKPPRKGLNGGWIKIGMSITFYIQVGTLCYGMVIYGTGRI